VTVLAEAEHYVSTEGDADELQNQSQTANQINTFDPLDTRSPLIRSQSFNLLIDFEIPDVP
jgi:hypothetical protein